MATIGERARSPLGSKQGWQSIHSTWSTQQEVVSQVRKVGKWRAYMPDKKSCRPSLPPPPPAAAFFLASRSSARPAGLADRLRFLPGVSRGLGLGVVQGLDAEEARAEEGAGDDVRGSGTGERRAGVGVGDARAEAGAEGVVAGACGGGGVKNDAAAASFDWKTGSLVG